jgi:hypothetical protein
MLLYMKPQQIGGPVSAMASMRADNDAGLFTGDETPFAFASGPWSTVRFAEGGRTVRPNLRFDFEVPSTADSSHLSRSWSRSGTRSYRMAPDEEYSPAIRRRLGDVSMGLSAVDVGFWMHSETPGTMVTAVVSIDRDGTQLAWFGKDLYADSTKQGGRLNCDFLLRDLAVAPDDIISVYLWKRGGAEAFIDDMDIYFIGTTIPGQERGKAIALDSLGHGGPTPLGYAGIQVKDMPVDTGRFRVGGPAPPTTVDAVPIGGTDRQWRFVPREGLAYLVDSNGTPTALVRPRSELTHKDVTHFERVVAETRPQGILLTGFDVDHATQGDASSTIAGTPAPFSMLLELPPPR